LGHLESLDREASLEDRFMALKSFIAGLGENPNFVAFNAHWGFAFFVVVVALQCGAPLGAVIPICVALAGYKEFIFDKHQEKAPPQSFADNLLDFSGYVTGISLGLIFFGLVHIGVL